jgi:uncharacterized membrane-anchored protein
MLALLLLSISLASSIVNAQELFYYHPGHFSFNLPTGWKLIPNKVVDQYAEDLMKRYKNLSKPKADVVFNRSNASWPFEMPYFEITVWKTIVNNFVIDKYISSAQQETKEVFEENPLRDLFQGALIKQPIYDKDKHTLMYSIETNINTPKRKDFYQTIVISIIFYKEGIVSFIFHCSPDEIPKYWPTVKGIIQSFTFDEGYEYRD